MRRLAIALAAGLLIASVAGPVSASGPATRGFLPANAAPHGRSLVDIGTAWNAWALSPPADTNPWLLGRCAQSPLDPKIWFLPEPYPGGPTTSGCEAPQGAFLVVSPFFMECSNAEEYPFYGANEADLRLCVEAAFASLSSVEVTLDGQTATGLADYVVTTRIDTVDSFLGSATLTMNRGFFMAVAPLSRGTHTLSANWDAMGYQAAITFTIIVH